MNLVKTLKAGECGVMRCQNPSMVLVDGASFGRDGAQVPLCSRHAGADMTQAPPAPGATLVVGAEDPLMPADVQAEVQGEAIIAREARAEIQVFLIENDNDLTFASEVLGEVMGHYNRLDEREKQATGPLNKALKVIRDWFRPAKEDYAAAKIAIKDKIAAYHTLRTKERQAALEAAAAAHRAGDAAATQIAVTAVPEAPPKTDGASVRVVWTYELVDFALVPDKYKVLHHTLLTETVKLSGAATNIPGIRAIQENKVIGRAT